MKMCLCPKIFKWENIILIFLYRNTINVIYAAKSQDFRSPYNLYWAASPIE